MRQTTLLAFLVIFSIDAISQNKIPLDHDVYEDWKELNNHIISSDGRFISFEVNPQMGDGSLIIHDLKKATNDTIPRGYKASFSFDSRYIIGHIKPPYDSTRAAKKLKKTGDKLPKDSLFIFYFEDSKLQKYANVRSYKISEEGKNVILFHHAYVPEKNSDGDKKETEEIDPEVENKFKKIVRNHKLADLVVLDPESYESRSFENVSSYNISKNGKLIGFHQLARDSILFSVTYSYGTNDNILNICHESKGLASKVVCDNAGQQLAFLFNPDTSRISGLELHHWKPGDRSSLVLIDTIGTGLNGNSLVNKYADIYFSGDSRRLFFGTSEKKEIEPKDTILKEDKVSLDIWNWKDQLLQPMQLKQLKNEKKRTYLAFYNLNSKEMIQLADEKVRSIRTMHEGTGDVMIGFADEHYGKYLSWEGLRYRDIYVIDPENGDRKLLKEKLSSTVILSPFGKYILYYSREDSSWYSQNIQNNSTFNLTRKTGINFYDEWNDIPQLPRSYGAAGFTENDEFVLIYDRYDIWKIDPSGKNEPVNLTQGYGRENMIRFRYYKLDEKEYFINLDQVLYFSAFNEKTMKAGLFRFQNGKLDHLVMSPHSYFGLKKAKNDNTFVYRKGNFNEFNDLFVSNKDFEKAIRISNGNPQSSNYLWGNVKLVEWKSFDGKKLKGLLYTPENLDSEGDYPMLVYFYERSSDRIHNHRIPSPSRSIINPVWCTSNEYVVFVPDIIYRTGYPGQSAYDTIVSGTQAMLERYPFIDSDRIGLQGQSWGGYQVAWLITQTNMFKAAMAGAPVSNMTSAYGGIRWGTGMSRMFQYERTQSRIGGTLWEKQPLYLENSPLFHVPKIQTPVLIMHNDNDGAVPWYQGIEFLVALRRLGKPAWMLTYNNEEHNLTRWPNRIDLDIRMMQFFDHYLKGKEMPAWMSDGVPAMDKNEVTGRKLLENQ
jgi:dipeptidyl aminopeptidase/acylaminoacyl peptidase